MASKRNIFLSLILLVLPISVFGQTLGPSEGSSNGSVYSVIHSRNASSVRYKGFVEGGIGLEVYESEFGFELSTSHGVIFDNGFFGGAYANYFIIDGSNDAWSFGLDIRKFFRPSSIMQPYLGLQVGGVECYWSDDRKIHNETGIAVMPVVGLNFSVGGATLSLGVKSAFMFDYWPILFCIGFGF